MAGWERWEGRKGGKVVRWQGKACSRPFLGAIIAPSLMPSFSKKIFSLEMDKNDIWLEG